MTHSAAKSAILNSQFFLLLLVLVFLLVAYPFWDRSLLGLASLDLVLWGCCWPASTP